jgi:hypothetical protein
MFYSFQGVTAVEQQLARLIAPDTTPLAEAWARIIVEDNRVGVLRGEDAEGYPMLACESRTSNALSASHRSASGGMGAQNASPKLGSGLGTSIQSSPNLKSSQYKKLTGPPLAPRGEESRVIANFATQTHFEPGRTRVEAAWLDVVSPKGTPFLPFHFEGSGRLPQRDLAGIRPWGQAEIFNALENWIEDLLA